MSGLFAHDSRMMRFLSRMADMMILNLLYLLSCIPLVTIGAATSALYYVCFQLGTERECGLVQPYFRAFRQKFLQSTAVWILELLICADLALTIHLTVSNSGMIRFMAPAAWILLIWCLLVFGYIFPVISQIQNKTLKILKNSILICLRWFPQSLCIGLMNVFPFILFLLTPALFLRGGCLFLFLYFSTTAYVNTRMMQKIFSACPGYFPDWENSI